MEIRAQMDARRKRETEGVEEGRRIERTERKKESRDQFVRYLLVGPSSDSL